MLRMWAFMGSSKSSLTLPVRDCFCMRLAATRMTCTCLLVHCAAHVSDTGRC